MKSDLKKNTDQKLLLTALSLLLSSAELLVPRMCAIFFRTIRFFHRVASANSCSMSPTSGWWSPGISITIIIRIIIIMPVKTCVQFRRLWSKLRLPNVSFLLQTEGKQNVCNFYCKRRTSSPAAGKKHLLSQFAELQHSASPAFSNLYEPLCLIYKCFPGLSFIFLKCLFATVSPRSELLSASKAGELHKEGNPSLSLLQLPGKIPV